jgi:hypothetical protein
VNMARHPHMRGSDFHANNELAGCLHLRSGAFLAGHSPRVRPRPLRPLKPAPAQKQQIADSPASRASPPKQLLRPVLRPPPRPPLAGGWLSGLATGGLATGGKSVRTVLDAVKIRDLFRAAQEATGECVVH